MKTYLFNQPAGLGDIFFLMHLAQKYKKEGNSILWPTKFHYHNVQKNFPEVRFVPVDYFIGYDFYDNKREIFEDHKYIAMPFRWADVIMHDGKSNNATCMRNKYDLIGEDFTKWRDFKITRDHEMENKLFESLGLKDGDEYNLINENQTGIFQKTEIKVDNGLRNIYMNRDEPQYNLLDWLKVIYNSTTFHTVATSILNLFDSLDDIHVKEAHIYKRIWDDNHSWYDYYLGKTDYILH